jgi:AcrR family transcriptional regulator
MAVFWEKGYDNASMAELSEAMGLAPPSVYAAFGSKEGLFREAADLYGRCEGTDIWLPFQEAATAREAVAQFLARTARSFTRPDKPRGCMVILGGLHLDDDNAGPSQDLRQRRRASLQDIRARLDRAVAEGELPAGLDTTAIARFYIAVQEGMAIQARDGATREELMQIAAGALAAWPGLTRT